MALEVTHRSFTLQQKTRRRSNAACNTDTAASARQELGTKPHQMRELCHTGKRLQLDTAKIGCRRIKSAEKAFCHLFRHRNEGADIDLFLKTPLKTSPAHALLHGKVTLQDYHTDTNIAQLEIKPKSKLNTYGTRLFGSQSWLATYL